ncbi:hypothetical protein [Pseudomonas phage PIP]|nr:hypothetical protein [Pseudomonas phage PIP]
MSQGQAWSRSCQELPGPRVGDRYLEQESTRIAGGQVGRCQAARRPPACPDRTVSVARSRITLCGGPGTSSVACPAGRRSRVHRRIHRDRPGRWSGRTNVRAGYARRNKFHGITGHIGSPGWSGTPRRQTDSTCYNKAPWTSRPAEPARTGLPFAIYRVPWTYNPSGRTKSAGPAVLTQHLSHHPGWSALLGPLPYSFDYRVQSAMPRMRYHFHQVGALQTSGILGKVRDTSQTGSVVITGADHFARIITGSSTCPGGTDLRPGQD